ncbi:hypothetical protein KBC79_00775 [Candidatus Woesebacteria bacterium]|nr:hypothetical protein [Candidatus Woesebacteria bacterium]
MKLNKKTIQSVIVITITLTIAGAALTQSLYRDIKQSDRSQFAMGTLDLLLNDENNMAATSIEIANIGEKDSLEGSKLWVVKNNGSLPGKLSVDISNLVSQENGCNEPEALIDSTCDDPGVGLGELGSATHITLAMDDGQSVETLVVSDLGPTGLASFQQQWLEQVGKIVLPPGKSVDFILSWDIRGDEQSNQLQSDSLAFDVTFILNQMSKQ